MNGAGVDLDVAALAVRLRRDVDADVRFDPGSRRLYASDASNHRVLPVGVLMPRTTDGLVDAVAACAAAGVPVTVRGAGTSLAGQAVGPGVVVDTSRHLTRVLDLDASSATATVEPGVVLRDLQHRARPHGLRFGPAPSTANRAVVGGMLGNDACGAHSLAWGRTSDNVRSLDIALADGTRAHATAIPTVAARTRASAGDRWGEVLQGLLDLRTRIGPEVAARLPLTLPRLVSGLHLDALCGEDGLDLARLLVGSEGTCAVTTAATLSLVPLPAATAMVVLAYPDDVTAAAAVPALLRDGVIAVEGLDRMLVDGARRARQPSSALEYFADAGAWIVVELAGDDVVTVEAAAGELVADAGVPGRLVERAHHDEVWGVRRDGLGHIAHPSDGRRTLPGWEDAAVPVTSLATYLRELRVLLARHGLRAGVYGHYGDGCVHTKIDFDLASGDGRATYAAFLDDAVDLVVGLGGSLSGEHGDGRARSHHLARMFGPVLTDAVRRVVDLFDPDGVLNPGVLVDAAPPTTDLRESLPLATVTTTSAFTAHGGFAAAADRCVGAGTCRRDDDVATMCPSFRATHDEAHSTRGRVRLLAEVLRSDAAPDLGDPDLAAAMELCLACKACVAECPVGVDVAGLKAEVAHQRHDVGGVPRPLHGRLLGSIRTGLRLASSAPGLANRLADTRLGRRLWAGVGMDPGRRPPPLAPRPFRQARVPRVGDPTVTLFVDTVTDVFAPEVAAAAVRALTAAGHRVALATSGCCGRPRLAEGPLDRARVELTDLVARLDVDRPVVWLEPSCLSAVRDELPDLVTSDAAVRVRDRSVTLAELAVREDWDLRPLDADVAYHPHCHHRAVLGDDVDRVVLDRVGVTWDDLDAGCCGLAGGFGVVAGARAEVAAAVAEDRFAPRLRATPGRVVVMDGFSCREQVRHLELPVRPRHLAQVLDLALREVRPRS